MASAAAVQFQTHGQYASKKRGSIRSSMGRSSVGRDSMGSIMNGKQRNSVGGEVSVSEREFSSQYSTRRSSLMVHGRLIVKGPTLAIPDAFNEDDEERSRLTTDCSVMSATPSPHANTGGGLTISKDVSFQDAVRQTNQALKTSSIHGSRWIIEADSPYVRRWDIIVLVALIFTAIVTPYEVALLQTSVNALFWVNRLVDLTFLKDMGMNFCMTYYEESEFSGRWVKDGAKIRWRYLKGWFFVDLFSILPFDLLALLLGGDNSIEKFKVFRVVKLLRLLKMVRIVKASKIFRRWENSISISYSVLSLYKFGLLMICMGHWLACAWAMTAGLQERGSWILVYCDGDGDGDLDEWEAGGCGHFALYSASLYFSIMTITSIGYGDITPTTAAEHWVCVLIMFLGSAVWAYVIGNASGIVATMDQDAILHNQTMDHLNQFVRERRVPRELGVKLRAYFNFSRDLARTQNNRALIGEMSPALRKAVAAKNQRWVKRVPWCRHGLSYDLVIDLVQRMQGSAYTENEALPCQDMLVVMHKGVATRRGRVLLKGAFWGADLILHSPLLKDHSKVVSLTMVEVLACSREDVLALVARYPKDARLVRRRATWMALQKALLLILSFTRQKWSQGVGLTAAGFQLAKVGLTEDEAQRLEVFVYQVNPALYRQHRGRDRPQCLEAGGEGAGAGYAGAGGGGGGGGGAGAAQYLLDPNGQRRSALPAPSEGKGGGGGGGGGRGKEAGGGGGKGRRSAVSTRRGSLDAEEAAAAESLHLLGEKLADLNGRVEATSAQVAQLGLKLQHVSQLLLDGRKKSVGTLAQDLGRALGRRASSSPGGGGGGGEGGGGGGDGGGDAAGGGS